MSEQGDASNGAFRAGGGDAAEPDLKQHRLLDAGGPIEDDKTARQKMRQAWVNNDTGIDYSTGFDPENVCQKKIFRPLRSTYGSLSTPMSYFAYTGDLPMMRWLYVNGADTRDENVRGFFPMYAAARGGKLEACQWLYDHGAANDVKGRPQNDTGPLRFMTASLLWNAFLNSELDVSRWLILKGALCKDDGSGDLDLGLVRKSLDGGAVIDWHVHGIETRRMLLEWANQRQRDREAFFVFLTGAGKISPFEYSPSALRNLLLMRLLSERATDQILGSVPSDQHQQLWTNLISDEECSSPLNRLVGASGVLEMIADFAGVVKGQEAHIIRQLTEILPEFNAELKEKYKNDSDP